MCRSGLLAWTCGVVMFSCACRPGAGPQTGAQLATARPATSRTADPTPDHSPTPAGTLVAFLGDSLTAGRGLPAEEAFPRVVARLLADEGVAIRVVNAGVSGDTSAGGLARVDWLLSQQPDVVVVALGANDGLRGLPVPETTANLAGIVRRCQAAGARVLLTGMKVPPNYGPEYAAAFASLFPQVAAETGVALVPFLLEGVAARPELNLEDGIHPNAEGQRLLARNVLPELREMLRDPPLSGRGGER